MDATDQARTLYEAYQARDWDRAAGCLHPDAVVDLPATGERLVGAAGVLDFQRVYPEPWGELTVRRVVGGPADCAAEVQVIDPAGQRFGMAAFWRQADGLLRDGVEYWVTAGGEAPPAGRRSAFGDDDPA
jgi:ketosteroid isomerase-like protein